MTVYMRELNQGDMKLIYEIAQRALPLLNIKDLLALQVDISRVHISSPLNLQVLLEANSADFIHDISGIQLFINRKTGRLDKIFIPKCLTAVKE